MVATIVAQHFANRALPEKLRQSSLGCSKNGSDTYQRLRCEIGLVLLLEEKPSLVMEMSPKTASHCPYCGSRKLTKVDEKGAYFCDRCSAEFTLFAHSETLRSGLLELDRASRRVRLDGTELSLTAIEYRLLEFLVSHNGIICERGSLVNAVWGNSSIADHSLNVIILRLRKKIEADPSRPKVILSHRGFGYSFKEPS
jgi:DNA-binding winged helix-turn-helix (wHTH) protein